MLKCSLPSCDISVAFGKYAQPKSIIRDLVEEDLKCSTTNYQYCLQTNH